MQTAPDEDAEGATMMGQSSGRVLLVGDEPVVRKLISGHLVAAGYVVRAAVDGLDAIGKLRAGLPDLIISDLNLPRMSGRELLKVVRYRFPQIPVIALSAVASDQMPEGVAADACFDRSGSEFEQLLQMMSELTRNPPPRKVPRHFESHPVQAQWDRNGHYTLQCDDCLRVFSFPRCHSMGAMERSTVCLHCARVVRFLVPDEDPQGPALA